MIASIPTRAFCTSSVMLFFRGWPVGLMVWFLTGALVPAQEPGASAVEEGSTSFQSGGRRIKVETFLPKGTDKRPAVLVLYGSGGALLGKNQMTAFARRVAAGGMAAFLVHYFNRTGTLVTGDKGIDEHWPKWNATVRDGVGFVAAHPRVDARAIGSFGYSLGAFLAVSESTEDRRILAVAELAGGIFDKLHGKSRHFPSLLILHGRADERVPVRHADRLEKEARRTGTKPEVRIYDGEGHTLTPAALNDAETRALRFLQQRLGVTGKAARKT